MLKWEVEVFFLLRFGMPLFRVPFFIAPGCCRPQILNKFLFPHQTRLVWWQANGKECQSAHSSLDRIRSCSGVKREPIGRPAREPRVAWTCIDTRKCCWGLTHHRLLFNRSRVERRASWEVCTMRRALLRGSPSRWQAEKETCVAVSCGDHYPCGDSAELTAALYALCYFEESMTFSTAKRSIKPKGRNHK